MIPEEERVVTISHGGYAKTQPLAAYQAQRRGGKGKSATGVKDEDYIAHLLVANSHTTLLLFSSKGKVYWLKTYEIPEASRAARGRPLVNLLPLDDGEYITTMLPVEEYTEGHYIFMATANGTVKKTPLESFSRQRSVGLIALELDEGDVLIPRPSPMASGSHAVLRWRQGDSLQGVRRSRHGPYRPRCARHAPAGRAEADFDADPGRRQPDPHRFRAWFGKRTAITEFPEYKRGGQGVIAMVSNERNGRLVGAVQVLDGEEIMLISDQGTWCVPVSTKCPAWVVTPRA
jgi:DNA gyrase subunit A